MISSSYLDDDEEVVEHTDMQVSLNDDSSSEADAKAGEFIVVPW